MVALLSLLLELGFARVYWENELFRVVVLAPRGPLNVINDTERTR